MAKAKTKTKTSLHNGKLAIILFSFLLGLLLAVQMKNVIELRQLNLLGNESIDSLQEQIRNLSVANNELRDRNAALNQNLEELVQLGNNEDAQLNFYRQENERLSTFAGITPVKGPGLVITIDSPQNTSNVSASSILVIVNALKGNGAYAISVNGQRVVALSDISQTGSAENSNIIMNGTNISNSGSYEIRVIGEANKLQDFVSFHNSIWDSLRTAGNTVNFLYPNELTIEALAKDSPAYRQQLLEPVEE